MLRTKVCICVYSIDDCERNDLKCKLRCFYLSAPIRFLTNLQFIFSKVGTLYIKVCVYICVIMHHALHGIKLLYGPRSGNILKTKIHINTRTVSDLTS